MLRALPLAFSLGLAACAPAGPQVAAPAASPFVGSLAAAPSPQAAPSPTASTTCGRLHGGPPTQTDGVLTAGQSSGRFPVITFDCTDASRVVNATIETYVRARLPRSASDRVTVSCATTLLTSGLASLICIETAEYRGAAHPFHASKSFNFGVSGDSARLLSVDDLFLPGVDAATLLGAFAEPMLRARGVEPLAPEPVRVHDFLLARDGLIAHFPEYAVGAYIDGTQDVLIPYASLRRFMVPSLWAQPAEVDHARHDAL